MKNTCSISKYFIGVYIAVVLMAMLIPLHVHAQKKQPNFIIIFTDDQGYMVIWVAMEIQLLKRQTLTRWQQKGRSGQISMSLQTSVHHQELRL